MRRAVTYGLAAVLFFLATAGSAFVPSVSADDDYEEATRLLESGIILPLDEIIERARQVRAGRVIEAELERDGDRYYYELEILDADGVVWELALDAATGAPLGGTGERDD